MIPSAELMDTLRELDRIYNLDSTDNKMKVYVSKLGLIELCGWIEKAIDSIFQSYITEKALPRETKSCFTNKLEKIYGFSSKNLRDIMILAVGVIGLDYIESGLEGDGIKDNLYQSMNTLKKERDDAAHTYISALTTYESPSDVLSRAKAFEAHFLKLEKHLKSFTT